LRLPKAKHRREVRARAAGRVTRIDCEKIGVAALVIGAGRETKDDAIDRAVGLIVQKKLGEAVAKDEALCEIHYNDDARLGEAVALIESAYEIGEEAPAARKAVRGVICSSNFRIQES
jgi:pyrimidine-nucleoside phosphorylase